jgi:integrase
VTAEHRRNKDRKTGKLRVPDKIQQLADEITHTANTCKVSVLSTIQQFVTDYLKDKKPTLRPGTYAGYEQLWEKYLRPRIGSTVLRDFKRPDAYMLWQEISRVYPSLSRQTMNHIRFFLSGVFRAALNRGFMTGENPAEADLPNGLRGRSDTEAYTIEEVKRMLALFVGQLKAQALIALAFASGLRKSELSALDWSDYERTDTGGVIHVRRSNVRGLISKPKTESSADDVHISEDICWYIDQYSQSIGNPDAGFMFGHVPEKPMNMDSFVRWTILPVLARCASCGKQSAAHIEADHEYHRNETVPEWKGFHAFRRGNATHLATLTSGDGMRTASIVLRHSDEGVTATHYTKISRQQKRVLAARKVVEITDTRKRAAEVVGAGLRQASLN